MSGRVASHISDQRPHLFNPTMGGNSRPNTNAAALIPRYTPDVSHEAVEYRCAVNSSRSRSVSPAFGLSRAIARRDGAWTRRARLFITPFT